MKIVMLVAAHKDYWMPSDRIYKPIQVGAAGKAPLHPDWLRDDTGDQISRKNAGFCELTGYYWAWKNYPAEVYGTCHYRRYFAKHALGQPKKQRLLTAAQIQRLLQNADMVLPPKRHYWIETRESQYSHAHNAQDLQCARQVLTEKYPEYLPEWEQVMHSRSGHIFNMLIARRPVFDAYYTWLFDMLFEVEKRLDTSGYSPSDQRVFGYLAERLLDVYVLHNHLRWVECPVVNLENQHWLSKGRAFLKRKFGKK